MLLSIVSKFPVSLHNISTTELQDFGEASQRRIPLIISNSLEGSAGQLVPRTRETRLDFFFLPRCIGVNFCFFFIKEKEMKKICYT